MPNTPNILRLQPHPSQQIDTSETIEFEFDGSLYQAYKGDTITSALSASGIKIVGRSFKYHRARGILCAAGNCPNCLMTVNGIPNVRTCTEQVSPDMIVRHQNAWPNLSHDAMSFLDRFDWLMPVGFYYKTFYKPKFFWHLARPLIRRAAGLGKVDPKTEGRKFHHKYDHSDIAIIGGGPSGMATALSAASPNTKVVLIEKQNQLGGSLQSDLGNYSINGISKTTGYEIGRELKESVETNEHIKVMTGSQVFGLYEGNLVGILSGTSMVKLRSQKVVLATGAYEQSLVFDGNDTPGVMLSTAIQRMIHIYGIKLGTTAVIGTSNDQGYYTALDLHATGVKIAAIVDSRPSFPIHLEAAKTIQGKGILILTSHAINRAEGHNKVIGAVASRIGDGVFLKEERQFDCDLIAMSGGFQPAIEMLHQAGGKALYDNHLCETVPDKVPSDMLVVGDATGIHDLELSIMQGRCAGHQAAHKDTTEFENMQSSLDHAINKYRDTLHISKTPTINHSVGAKQFICYCEDVTAKEIVHANKEGFEDIQILKRYTTTTMGPCQGKMCHSNFAKLTAENIGKDVGSIGTTTQRQPINPIPLGALAGPSHLPVKLTSTDSRHRHLGAEMVDVGPWQRPYSYGSPHSEAMNVREKVGIIDVSTLGKLDVWGKDAGVLIDKVYTHHFSNLRPGRVRYGLLCGDNGTILDDGTVTRMTKNRYFITTSTSNIELIEEWLKWWMAGTEIRSFITNLTSGLAAFNIAGPEARNTLAKLTELDLTSNVFRYMSAKKGDLAGVPALFLRIGFVGESGWEVHFPAEYGEYIWDTILDAGKEFGILPFGTEAQRILRLEKAHIIPSQDTDLTSNPIAANMDWTVKFDKEDFIGRAALTSINDQGSDQKLVGFIMNDETVPKDGVPIMHNDEPIGRVTSSRLSPTLNKGFGLAWIPTEMAVHGNEIQIRVQGKLVPARVTENPVYDPSGERLRS